jgi:ribosomal protein S12 methylthiotransferase
VRLHYVYPYPHVDEVVPLMSDGGRGVLPYLDVPFQHASRRILKLMKRPANAENTLERIRAWRAIRPKLTIRSTFIVGFPGETEGEFEELLAFLDEAELDRVGCFAYSPVDGATANALPGALPEAIKEERRARLMMTQAAISARRLRAQVGRTIDVLVDAIDGRRAIARGPGDAPEIDGIVSVIDGDALAVGEFARVTITEADQHDLVARRA